MTDYTKLVEDLRDIEKTMFALGTSPTNMNNVSINLAYDKKWGYTAADAAAAIEALQAENADIREELFISQRKYDEFTTIASMQNAMLAKQLPKRGEIVRCRECIHFTQGGWCDREFDWFPVDENDFCSMAEKMEVQDGENES